jgi:hypothetical protein
MTPWEIEEARALVIRKAVASVNAELTSAKPQACEGQTKQEQIAALLLIRQELANHFFFAASDNIEYFRYIIEKILNVLTKGQNAV